MDYTSELIKVCIILVRWCFICANLDWANDEMLLTIHCLKNFVKFHCEEGF